MSQPKVVVTGLGILSAIGNDRPSFWNALCQGRNGFAPIKTIDPNSLRFKIVIIWRTNNSNTWTALPSLP